MTDSTATVPRQSRPAVDNTADAASVEFRGLRREFGATVALDGLDLTVRPGELLALLGPSGCGKTTALRMLAGFEHPDAGQVLVDGEDVTAVPAHRRDAGMVFQSYSLFPHLNALDNVAFGLRMRKVRATERRARAAELLELVGLPDKGDRFPHQLSGGQQQRIALARALALRPRVLLLDEPLSALDAKVRLTLREEIRRLQQELGITTLFVTHDQEEALSMADRVAVMRAGRLEQCAVPSELYGRPATAFVAEFVGTMNRIPGRLADDRTVVEVLGRRLPVDGEAPHGPEADVLVRPEAVRVTTDPQGTAQVTGSAFLGAVTRLTVRLPDGSDGTEIKADLPTDSAAAFAPGTRVTVSLPDRPVLVADRTL
ncbi:ABC transporter ATP-binding protein [Streptomyces purpurogeneiscleroticus]|uniref:ABC transporter ATP-binding protein n=1 Tax=Streptomyces purpurogeneiscleroticus TaxID=68259 RepID=UPI001CBB168B|nr:ABC transporter ATP-binding protein [Streptomyces purpurogeneiscleroticus]MBZ4016415.1 spermidine/putrescine ABC transporter ATP-binding protein [Streptomyces purpurogeneiscleroticus]